MADRVMEQLSSSEAPLDDDQLALILGTRRAHINMVCRKLEDQGLIRRSKADGRKIVNQLSPTPLITMQTIPLQNTSQAEVAAVTGADFEVHARRTLEERWGVTLVSRVVTLLGGVTHSFDLVSPDGAIVGDAKYYKDLKPIPAAKLATISEYVFLLHHVRAERQFLVFGQDRAVPERWLKRFSPLLGGVEFWFLEGEDLTRMA